jgi:hypothetical protein
MMQNSKISGAGTSPKKSMLLRGIMRDGERKKAVVNYTLKNYGNNGKNGYWVVIAYVTFIA